MLLSLAQWLWILWESHVWELVVHVLFDVFCLASWAVGALLIVALVEVTDVELAVLVLPADQGRVELLLHDIISNASHADQDIPAKLFVDDENLLFHWVWLLIFDFG